MGIDWKLEWMREDGDDKEREGLEQNFSLRELFISGPEQIPAYPSSQRQLLQGSDGTGRLGLGVGADS